MTGCQDAVPLDEGVVPRHSPRIAARVVEGVALVIVLEQQEVHRLDPVGSRIWELCDGRSVGEICDVVVFEFDVERSEALDDLRGFLHELAAKGAIVLEGGTS